MPPHCRVTFFDNAHQIRRTLEIHAALPLVAAERALAWLMEHHVQPEDLGPSVHVEIIRTAEQTIPLSTVLRGDLVPKTKVA
jgi:hypothetical protein